MERIVIAGGSLGGLRATEALYGAGFEGEIVVVSEEVHPPYTRPPLSKLALAEAPDLAALQFKRRPESDRATWRFGTTVTGSDLGSRTVELSDGDTLEFDGLVAATGVRPRRLPTTTAGALTIRTFDDCVALQPRLRPGARVVIIGSGFIGCEVAATAIRLGCRVDVVSIDDVPLEVPLGKAVGAAVQGRHEKEGVRFHLRTSVAADGAGTVGTTSVVVLDDGTELPCDVLVEAVGSQPCVEWLVDNELDLSDGVVCDNWMRMGGRASMVAVGDVARFPNPLFDDVPRRVEHWQMPTETARRATQTLLADLAERPADERSFAPLPSFWSDQYDLRIQSFGALGLADEVTLLEGSLDDEAVVGYLRRGHLVGALMLGLPRRMVAVRRQVMAALSEGNGPLS